MDDLIDLYFTNINIYMPLLHRPTFEQQIGDGLHLRDEGFGSTVLLVCAVGARYSDDPRVFLKDYPDNTHSAGWEWFTKVNTMRRSHFEVPRLYDLQICCVCSGVAPKHTVDPANLTRLVVNGVFHRLHLCARGELDGDWDRDPHGTGRGSTLR